MKSSGFIGLDYSPFVKAATYQMNEGVKQSDNEIHSKDKNFVEKNQLTFKMVPQYSFFQVMIIKNFQRVMR